MSTRLLVTGCVAVMSMAFVSGQSGPSTRSANFTGKWLEAVRLLLESGLDPNAQADTGRVALHGAAHKGRPAVVQLLADHGAKLDVRDYGNTDNRGGKLAVHTWQPVDYADGLVRVGVQSAIAHPDTGFLIRKLMATAGLPVPPMGRTLESICITDACD